LTPGGVPIKRVKSGGARLDLKFGMEEMNFISPSKRGKAKEYCKVIGELKSFGRTYSKTF